MGIEVAPEEQFGLSKLIGKGGPAKAPSYRTGRDLTHRKGLPSSAEWFWLYAL